MNLKVKYVIIFGILSFYYLFLIIQQNNYREKEEERYINSIKVLKPKEYLKEYPNGRFVKKYNLIKDSIESLQVIRSKSPKKILEYLSNNQNGRFKPEVQKLYDSLESANYKTVRSNWSDPLILDSFIEDFPQSRYTESVSRRYRQLASRMKREDLLIAKTLRQKTEKAYKEYLEKYPNGKAAVDIRRRLKKLLTIQRERNKSIPTNSNEKCLPNLTLHNPIVSGANVSINGVALPHSGCPQIKRVHWAWGDQTNNESWFPASHSYVNPGKYTISVTAYDEQGNYAIKKTNVTIVVPTYPPIENAPGRNNRALSRCNIPASWGEYWAVTQMATGIIPGTNNETYGWKQRGTINLGEARPPKTGEFDFLCLRPVNKQVPAIIEGKFKVNSKQLSLFFLVSGKREYNFKLFLFINGEQKMRRAIWGGPWRSFTYSMHDYSGQIITVQFRIFATGKIKNSYAFFSKIRFSDFNTKQSVPAR